MNAVNAGDMGGDAMRPGPPADPRVTLYSKPGCHLCDEARKVVEAVCDSLRVSWVEVDITQEPALNTRYQEQIPVTLVDGRQHDFWSVDAGRLRSALQP